MSCSESFAVGGTAPRDSVISCRGMVGLPADLPGQTTEKEDPGVPILAAGVPKHPAMLRSRVNSQAEDRNLTYEKSMTCAACGGAGLHPAGGLQTRVASLRAADWKSARRLKNLPHF